MIAILSIVIIQMGIPLFWGNAFKRKKIMKWYSYCTELHP